MISVRTAMSLCMTSYIVARGAENRRITSLGSPLQCLAFDLYAALEVEMCPPRSAGNAWLKTNPTSY